MSKSINKIILLGHLGGDVELRTTRAGVKVAHVSLATNSVYTNAAGAREERVQWHRLVAWKGAAETLARYAHKGDQLYVEGELSYDKYTGGDGVERLSCEVFVREFAFVGRTRGDAPATRPPERPLVGAGAPAEVDDSDLPW